MNKSDNSKQKRFFWSYAFFYYTLLKHYRKEEHGVSDIAPWVAVCFLAFWWSGLYVSATIYLVGNCHKNYLAINFFAEENDWFNRATVFLIPFVLNALYFLIKNRYKMYEKIFDSLPIEIKNRGRKISWFVLYSGFVFVFLMMLWFADSPC